MHGANNENVEGNHLNLITLVEGELHGSIPNVNTNRTDNFHGVSDNVSSVGEGYETDEIFEDVPLDFDLADPPMDKWTQSHPNEHVLGDPHVGVMKRAQIRAKNEILNVHQE